LVTVAVWCHRSESRAGSVVVWGGSQTNVPALLNGEDITAISCALDHTLALKANGTVVAWGFNFDGQCNVPPDLANVVKVVAGEFFSLVLRSDGSLVAWGDNDYGQQGVPPGLTGVVDIAAGRGHCLARKSDGTVVAWGSNAYGQTNVPPGLSGVTSILAEWNYSVALLNNGTVVAWGVNDAGQTSVPAGLNNVVAISGNQSFCLALKGDGTVVGWGAVPPIPAGLGGVVGIAAGETHCLALKSDGTIIAWGDNESGQTTVPGGLADGIAVGAAWNYSIALVGSAASGPFAMSNPQRVGNTFSVTINSQSGSSYVLEYKNSLGDAAWNGLSPLSGTGSQIVLTDPSASVSSRIYRVRRQ